MTQKPQSRNLSGKDFSGKNLEGEDFSYANIRGTDFSDANLTNTNFSHAQAGLPKPWFISLSFLSLLLAFIAGLIAAYAGAVMGHLFVEDADELSLFGFISAVALVIFIFIILYKGLGTTLTNLAEIVAFALIIATFLIAAIAFFPENNTGHDLTIGANFTILGLVGAIAAIIDMALTVAMGKMLPLPFPKLLTGFLAIFGAIIEENYLDRLERLLTKAIENPQTNNYINTEGEFNMTQGKGNVNIGKTKGNISGVAAAGESLSMTGVALGEISGNVTNTIKQLPDNSEPKKPGIKELLSQLQTAIETENNLSEEDKKEVLEEIKTF